MENKITIYHGSENIIKKPIYGVGREHNDYGLGFYCTEEIELAKEWACNSLRDGFANEYQLDTSYMKILKLNSEEYTILHWMSVLVSHRLFRIKNPIAGRAKKYLQDVFSVNVNAYDVITGYRADDAYYDYADAFLNNAITVNQLAEAMRLGKLGQQVVLKSAFAFEQVQFVASHPSNHLEYYPKRKERSDTAQQEYFERINLMEDDGLYMADIIREKVTKDDLRIPRNVSE